MVYNLNGNLSCLFDQEGTYIKKWSLEKCYITFWRGNLITILIMTVRLYKQTLQEPRCTCFLILTILNALINKNIKSSKDASGNLGRRFFRVEKQFRERLLFLHKGKQQWWCYDVCIHYKSCRNIMVVKIYKSSV